MATTMDFPRGDGVTHYFAMPASAWSAGGKLFFGAKVAPDDDVTDASAEIKGVFTDANTATDGTTVTYTCYFPPSATNTIKTDGADSVTLEGEFQWVNASGVPSTFPATTPKIPVLVVADIVMETA